MPNELRAGTTVGGSTVASLHSHAVAGGDAAWSVADSTDPAFLKPSMSSAIKVQCTAAGTVQSSYYLQWAMTAPMSTTSGFTIPIYTTGGAADEIKLFVAEDTGFANYYTWTSLTQLDTVRTGWRVYHFNKPNSAVNGSPVETNNWTRIRLRIYIPAGTTNTFYIGPITKDLRTMPMLALSFDDGTADHFSEAFAYMNPRGLVGSLAISPNILQIAEADLRTIYNAGWSFHNHGWMHEDWATLTPSQLEEEVGLARGWLESRGYLRGTRDAIYPYGSTDDDVISHLQRLSYRSACVVPQGYESIWETELDSPFKIYRSSITQSTSVATFKARVDKAIQAGAAIIFTFHEIIVGATGNDMEPAVFKEMVDYVYQKRSLIKVTTVADIVDSLGRSTPKRGRRTDTY